MNSYNGIPIDKGGLITAIIVHGIMLVLIALALYGVILDLKKRISIYRKACKKEPAINKDNENYEKKLRKFNRRKQASKKKAGFKVIADACAVLAVCFCVLVISVSFFGAVADSVLEDYCDVVSEYEIIARRTHGRMREYVVLEDGTTLHWDAIVGGERYDTGKGRFIYAKRSDVIVGFEKID